MDLADFDQLMHAQTGNLEPLAKHIESDGYLSPETRAWLAAHLQGTLKVRRGNKRTWAQINKEMKITSLLNAIRNHFGTTENDALEKLLDLRPELNRDTVKTYLRKAKLRRAAARRHG